MRRSVSGTALTARLRAAPAAAVRAVRCAPSRALGLGRALPATIGWTGVVMVAVLAVAAYLRLRGMSWGLPYGYQDPDEHVVLSRAFRVAAGHPNPEFFYYPSLIFYLIGGVTWAASWFHAAHGVSFLSPAAFVTDPTPYYLIGRSVVVVCGVTSVYLVYRLGKEAFSRPVGLLAALFLAVEPLHVRYSHLAVTDVPATMFGLLALVFFVRAARLGSSRSLLYGALAAGLATGTSTTSACSSCPASSPAATSIAMAWARIGCGPWAYASRVVSLPQWPSPFL